ncbi:TPA: hypothetical protein RY409_004371 [Escherichia albertii]|nr:hypothetical protein [Escherichia albertii]EHW5313775.1 hypothetical protein [Escherichia albertii]EHW5858893.1 hypothetical protein [Escherichia albertii]HCS7033628.1 hypothetical protein [Escherichia albertii]HCS7461123.1 hypothetical protein [Escherichia albertii]
MGELRHYGISIIDEHSNLALALVVPYLNSDIVRHFFSVGINQIIADNGKEFLGKIDKCCRDTPSGIYGFIPIR